jgi:hypothetical protein
MPRGQRCPLFSWPIYISGFVICPRHREGFSIQLQRLRFPICGQLAILVWPPQGDPSEGAGGISADAQAKPLETGVSGNALDVCQTAMGLEAGRTDAMTDGRCQASQTSSLTRTIAGGYADCKARGPARPNPDQARPRHLVQDLACRHARRRSASVCPRCPARSIAQHSPHPSAAPLPGAEGGS